jgi:hypothetical protein
MGKFVPHGNPTEYRNACGLRNVRRDKIPYPIFNSASSSGTLDRCMDSKPGDVKRFVLGGIELTHMIFIRQINLHYFSHYLFSSDHSHCD